MVDIIEEINKNISQKKPQVDKGLLFNLIKYFVAILPVVVPLCGIYYLTNDFIIAIIITLVLDLALIIGSAVYIFNNQDIIDAYKK